MTFADKRLKSVFTGAVLLLSSGAAVGAIPPPVQEEQEPEAPAALCALADSEKAVQKPSGKFAAFVMEAESGLVLHEDQADDFRYPASVTKIMTVYLLFDEIKAGRLKKEDIIEVSLAKPVSPLEGSLLGLKNKDKISVDQLIKAIITKSANDAAVAVANHLAGSEKEFAARMTKKACELGMNRTLFQNASGLPHAHQVTTARDMALLGRALMQDHPEFYSYFSLRGFTYKRVRYDTNNRMMRNYEGMDGIKTGWIKSAGYNLVASAEREGKRLITVVFGGATAEARNRRVARLFDQNFSLLAEAGEDKSVEKSEVASSAPSLGK